MKKTYRFMVAVSLAVVAVYAVYLKMGIYFETNDDRNIAEILSGAITQTPSAYVQLVSYILTAPLAWLYRMAGGIPWYGLCLILFHVISYTVIFEGFLSRFSKNYEMLLGMGLCGFIFLCNLYSIGLIQWTSTAALLAIAGYVYLILYFDNKAVVVFAVLELLGFLLRGDAMLMIQPLGAAVLLGFFLGRREWREKRQRDMILKWALVIAGVLVIGTMSRWITYRSDEWKEADAYYDASVTLVDYYEPPAYKEVRDILDKYQITETEYEGYVNWVMVGSHIKADCLEELAEYMKSQHSADINLFNLIGSSVEKLLESSLSCNRQVRLMWACVLLWMFLAKRWDIIIPALGLGAARTAVWSYLIYKGRMPNRVTFPLFFAELLLLLVMILNHCGKEDIKSHWQKLAALCLCVMAAYGGFRTGQSQYRWVNAVNDAQAIYIRGYEEIKEYCRQYPDNRYVLDTFSFMFYTGSALEKELYKPGNSIYSGTWIGQSPVNKKYEQDYLGEEWKDLYVIVYDDGQPMDVQEKNIIVRYFAEKTGLQPSLSDAITVSHGGAYLIWHFGEE